MIEFVFCTECQSRANLSNDILELIDNGNAQQKRITCPKGHAFSVHEGIMEVRSRPNYYDVFRNIQGIESGSVELDVGDWQVVSLNKQFDEIDEIKTIHYPLENGLSLPSVRTSASFDRNNTKSFWLLTSGKVDDLGTKVRINWVVYGPIACDYGDIWRENLVFAARLLLSHNYRPSVIQSAIAIESFIYEFVKQKLSSLGWNSSIINRYIDGASIDSLSLNGVIRLCIQEILGINIPSEVELSWARLKHMRDALAHGDIRRYEDVKKKNGNEFSSEKARAEFAYHAAIKMIYEIKYSDIAQRV